MARRRKKTGATKGVAPLKVPEVRAKAAAWEAQDEEFELTAAELEKLEKLVEESKHQKMIPAEVVIAELKRRHGLR